MTAELDPAEQARRLFAGRVEFLKSAPALKFLPDPDAPEIAFCGRSNVGKSTLLNAITGRRSIARASVTPGRTQELNFFDVGPEDAVRLRLVDMPGYGYAEAPKDMVRQWAHLVNDYLRGRATLKRVLVLVDSRHGLKPVDREIMEMLDKAAVSYQIVLTKTDKIKAADVPKLITETTAKVAKRPAAYPGILATSSEKAAGLDELRAEIVKTLGLTG